MTTDYAKLLILAYPGQGWSLRDNHNFESLHWDDSNGIEKPSLADLSQKMDSVKPEEALRLLREKRDVLLAESDKYVLPDFPSPPRLDDISNHCLSHRESSVIWPFKPTLS